MKFMMIMQGTRKGWESMGTWKPEEIGAHIKFMKDLNKELVASGEFVLAEGLDLPMNAKIVSATNAAKPTITDGPFPEAKEFLAGFWIIDVPNEKRAIEIAARASTAPGKGGTPMGIPIELRAIGCAPEVD